MSLYLAARLAKEFPLNELYSDLTMVPWYSFELHRELRLFPKNKGYYSHKEDGR
jgi:hypothetical protein